MATRFEDKTASQAGYTTTHYANTWIDTAGSGLLLGLRFDRDSSGTDEVAVQIDGGTIWRFSLPASTHCDVLLLWPYKTSLKITGEEAANFEQSAWYLPD